MPLTQEILDLYPHLIAQMPDEFTSHKFILKLACNHQKIYIEALYPYRASEAPFRALHVEMAHAIANHCDRIGEVDSVNIFGKPSPCMKWKKW